MKQPTKTEKIVEVIRMKDENNNQDCNGLQNCRGCIKCDNLIKPNQYKPVFNLFPEALERIKENKCAFCNKGIIESEFKDELSKKEYSISGLCQGCQDKTFGKK